MHFLSIRRIHPPPSTTLPPSLPHPSQPPSLAVMSERPARKWSVRIAPDWSFDFDSREPLPSLHSPEIDWSTAEGVQRSEGGSEGVFFIGLPEQRAVVLKGSMSLAGELFYSLLARRLGIRVPDFRLVTPVQLEAAEGGRDRGSVLAETGMSRKLLELDAQHPLYRHVQSSGVLRRWYVMLQEFIPGNSLTQLKEEETETVFGTEGQLSGAGRTVLRDIGRMIGLDLFCHNTDRLPFIADNRGNPANLMFQRRTKQLVPIDNVASPIRDDSPLFQRYLTEVQQLLSGSDHQVLKRCRRVRDLIFEHSGFDIDASGVATRDAAAEEEEDDSPPVVEYIIGSKEIRAGFFAFLESLDGVELAEILELCDLLRSGGAGATGAERMNPVFFGSLLLLCQHRGVLPESTKTLQDLVAKVTEDLQKLREGQQQQQEEDRKEEQKEADKDQDQKAADDKKPTPEEDFAQMNRFITRVNEYHRD